MRWSVDHQMVGKDRECSFFHTNAISDILIAREETITTVVKNPRSKRRVSPARLSSGYFPSYLPRSEMPTLEPMTKIRQPLQRHDPESVLKAAVPTLFVSEPDERQGAAGGGIIVETIIEEQKPKWVEVEEIIEFNVKKPTQTPRKRGASPLRVERDESALGFSWPGPRPRRSSEDDPNANNSNNKLVEQDDSSQPPEVEVPQADPSRMPTSNETVHCFYRSEQEGKSYSVEMSSKIGSPVPSVLVEEPFEATEVGNDGCLPSPRDPEFQDAAAELNSAWAGEQGSTGPVQDEGLIKDDDVVIDEPEEAKMDNLRDRDLKILTRNGKVLTLEDLEDYVPEEGETYRCGNPNSAEDKPCEIAVLQTEINKPTIGRPVLLNVGRPVVSQQRSTTFFSTFEDRHPGEVFMTPSRGPANMSFHVNETCGTARATAASHPATVGAPTGASFTVKPSFCTEVQLSADNGQSSFKSEVSTRTLNYSTVGEPVTLKKEDPSQS